MIVGVLPCLIARLDNLGLVGDFVAAFSFAKSQLLVISLYALLNVNAVLLLLLYAKYLFLLIFPVVLMVIFTRLNKDYLLWSKSEPPEISSGIYYGSALFLLAYTAIIVSRDSTCYLTVLTV